MPAGSVIPICCPRERYSGKHTSHHGDPTSDSSGNDGASLRMWCQVSNSIPLDHGKQRVAIVSKAIFCSVVWPCLRGQLSCTPRISTLLKNCHVPTRTRQHLRIRPHGRSDLEAEDSLAKSKELHEKIAKDKGNDKMKTRTSARAT